MIEIRTIEEFLNIKDNMEETYILKNDLDFKNVSIEVLVNSINTNINNANTYSSNINLAAQTENVESFLIQSLLDFTGILDGNNYKIKNLNFTGFSIFYKISGTIKNLFFENCVIGDTTNYNGCCLLSCICENATFENIYADNIKIIGCGYSYYYAAYYRNFLGGFCSLNFGNTSFNNCYLSVEFITDYKGTKNIGGFLSYSTGDLFITNSYCNTIFTNTEQFKRTGLIHVLGCLIAQLDYNSNLTLNSIRCLSNINYNQTSINSINVSNFIGSINNTSGKDLILENIDIINDSSFLQNYENDYSFFGLGDYIGTNNIILKDIKNSGTVKTNYKYRFLSTPTTTNISVNNFYSCLDLYINKYYRKSNTYLISNGILNLKNVIFENIITKYNTNTNIYYTNTNNNLISNTYSLINNGELDKNNINFLDTINYSKIFTDSSNWNFNKTADLIIVYIKKDEVYIVSVNYDNSPINIFYKDTFNKNNFYVNVIISYSNGEEEKQNIQLINNSFTTKLCNIYTFRNTIKILEKTYIISKDVIVNKVEVKDVLFENKHIVIEEEEKQNIINTFSNTVEFIYNNGIKEMFKLDTTKWLCPNFNINKNDTYTFIHNLSYLKTDYIKNLDYELIQDVLVKIVQILYKIKVKDNLYLNNMMYKVLNIYNSKQELVDYINVKEDNINKLDYINKKNKQKELLCNSNIISFHNKLYKITNIYNKDKVLDKIELENNYKININYL